MSHEQFLKDMHIGNFFLNETESNLIMWNSKDYDDVTVGNGEHHRPFFCLTQKSSLF